MLNIILKFPIPIQLNLFRFTQKLVLNYNTANLSFENLLAQVSLLEQVPKDEMILRCTVSIFTSLFLPPLSLIFQNSDRSAMI